MPTKRKKDIRRELLDELLAGYSKPEDLTGPDGLLKQLTGALVERALQAEMTDHLGYEPNAAEGRGSGNARNGVGNKTLTTDQGELPIEVPRDRQGTFEPKLVKKHQRRFTGFDDKILSHPRIPRIYGASAKGGERSIGGPSRAGPRPDARLSAGRRATTRPHAPRVPSPVPREALGLRPPRGPARASGRASRPSARGRGRTARATDRSPSPAS